MRKAIKWGFIIYVLIEISISLGYKKEKESDYILDTEEVLLPQEIIKDTIHFHKPDTTAYRGNWIDINE